MTAELTALALSPAEAERLAVHVAYLEARVAELTRRESALLRELEALRQRVSDVVATVRREPALTIFCDTPSCTTPPITRDVAPPEDAIPRWVRGLGWRVEGDAYVCPGCQRGEQAPLPVARVVQR